MKKQSNENDFFNFHFSGWACGEITDKWHLDFENKIKEQFQDAFRIGDKIDEYEAKEKISKIIEQNFENCGFLDCEYGIIPSTHQLGIQILYANTEETARTIKMLIG